MKKYPCPYCQEHFVLPQGLGRHVSTIHKLKYKGWKSQIGENGVQPEKRKKELKTKVVHLPEILTSLEAAVYACQDAKHEIESLITKNNVLQEKAEKYDALLSLIRKK